MTFLRCLCEERSDEAISWHYGTNGPVAAPFGCRAFGSQLRLTAMTSKKSSQ
jgi:hypothetical protein